jgi:hypothetical protein
MRTITTKGEIVINDDRVFHRKVLIEKSNRLLVIVDKYNTSIQNSEEIIVEPSILYVARDIYVIITKDWKVKNPENLGDIGNVLMKADCTIIKRHV